MNAKPCLIFFETFLVCSVLYFISYFNPFRAYVPILYTLKTPENQRLIKWVKKKMELILNDLVLLIVCIQGTNH